jgi:hypothetical protein
MNFISHLAYFLPSHLNVSHSQRCEGVVKQAITHVFTQILMITKCTPTLGSVDVGAAAPDGGCALRWQPQNSGWAYAS